MSRLTSWFAVSAVALTFLCGREASAVPIDLDALNWDLNYLIDQSESIDGDSQFARPRDNRGLAISPDGNYLYAGYNNGIRGECCEVRQLDVGRLSPTNDDYTSYTTSGSTGVIVNRLKGVRGKSIAVDDVGRVYFAEGTSIEVYSADLSTNLGSLGGLTKTEGVALNRESGGQLKMFTTDRDTKFVTKWDVDESGFTFTKDASFGTGGDRIINENIRGVSVAPDGTIFVTEFGSGAELTTGLNGKIHRVDPFGIDSWSRDNPQAMDVDVVDDVDDGLTALVSGWKTLDLGRFPFSEYDGTLLSLVFGFPPFTPPLPPPLDLPFGSVNVPAGNPGMDPTTGGLSGIAVAPDGTFYLASEEGQTLDLGDGTDDNEPIYHANNSPPLPPLLFAQGGAVVQNPEPSTMLMAVWAIALLGICRWRRSAR